MATYQIFTDSSCDLTTEMRQKAGIEYFRMGITVDGRDYPADLDFKEYSVDQLYKWIENPNVVIKTALVTVGHFIEMMEPFLEKGIDIFYVACTSVLSGTIGVFRLAKEQIQSKYPDRRIEFIDSCRAGMALGLIVMECAKLRDEGRNIDDLLDYVNDYKLNYNLCGTVMTLSYLKAAGRVSSASAFFGNLFNIKPVIIVDALGHNCAVAKEKGLKNAYKALVEFIRKTVEGQDDPVIYLGQGQNQEGSDYLKDIFERELGARVVEYVVGPIIGISCGPGVIHIACYGKVADIPIGK